MKIALKTTLKTTKPRNPYAAAAKGRKAGAHGARPDERHDRRAAKAGLRRLVTARSVDDTG